MLSVLLWILSGIGIIFLFVLPGKRKGRALLSDREAMISDAAKNIAAVTFILAQLLFPLYGYVMSPVGRVTQYDDRMNEFWKEFKVIFREYYVGFLPPFDLLRGKNVYLFVIIVCVFCFFAGMYLYKNGLNIRHRKLLFIPVLVLIATVIWSYFYRLHGKRRILPFVKYQVLIQLETIGRYLMCSFAMIAMLYGIYVLLKKLCKNEIVPILVILLLSFLSPYVHILNDGMHYTQPQISHMLFGPDIPLFPMGMLVMKYSDKILPRTKKGTLKHISLWAALSGASFCSLFGLLSLVASMAGVHFSDALSCFDTPEYRAKMRILREVYKVSCIPWLALGFCVSMLILSVALFAGSGNRVTRFFRDHACIVTVLLFSRHIFFEVSGHNHDFWSKLLKIPDKWLIAMPVFYFVLSLVLAFLIKRFILDRGRNKPA